MTKSAPNKQVFDAIKPLEESEPDVSSHKLSFLEGNILFQDFDRETLDEMHSRIHMRTCKKGHVFYTPDETGEVMFLLKQGSAQLYRMSEEGRKLVIAKVPPGSVFGEMSCIGQGMYDCFAESADDSIICTMSRTDVLYFISQYPDFAIRLLESVGQRVVAAERQLEDLAFKGLIPRICDLILREESVESFIRITHQEIGERLGVYRETVTYSLNELKSMRLIELGRGKIRVIDPETLKSIADQS